MLRNIVIFLLVLFSLGVRQVAVARVKTEKWGIAVSRTDSVLIKLSAFAAVDSLVHNSKGASKNVAYAIHRPRPYRNTAPDFYLLCGLCLMLGAIRYFDPRYFALLIGAYRNPGTGRQWSEMLKAATLSNFWMNLFFASVAGAYIYYLAGGAANRVAGMKAPLVLPVLIGGMLLIYMAKYVLVRFSGWAFRVETLAEQYIFNVFLVNKIIGIVLLPFVILIALLGPQWVGLLGVVSGMVALGLLSTRYLRSWPAFYNFFQGSKFHFFTYLCASEILPMAVLVKWLLHLIR